MIGVLPKRPRFGENTTLVAKNQQEIGQKGRNPTMKAVPTQEVPQKFNK
jgi:hypothetical protein